jgi:RHS repeat-associated protein
MAGMLKTVSIDGALVATYTHDARNLRTKKVLANPPPGTPATTLYRYDPEGRLTEEIAGSGASLGQTLVTYVWQDDIPVAVIYAAGTPSNAGSSERIVYLHTDHLNTPRKASDSQGRIVWKWESDAFGSTAPNEDPGAMGQRTVVNLRFPGQYFDAESGLHYNWNRYYDPGVGRYMQADPIGLAGGINSYIYVGGNPIIFSDPLGLCPAGTHLATPDEYSKILEKARAYTKKGLTHDDLQCNQLVDRSINDAFPGAVAGEPNTTAIGKGEGPFERLSSPVVGGIALLRSPSHVVFVTKTNQSSVTQFLGSQSSTGPAIKDLPDLYYWSPKFNKPGNVAYYGICLPN